MSLTQALNSALSGLQVTQANIAMVAANVANADTPGYTRKVVNQIATGANTSIGVRVSDIQREIDLYVQRQLRIENAGASYADTRADYVFAVAEYLRHSRESDTALESVYNSFTSSLQALSTSPDDPGARSAVISSAQLLTQQLNQLSDNVQSLRGNAELGIADAVNQANGAMSQIAALNQQIAASTPGDSATAALMDQRDSYIDQLSKLMDINVVQGDRSQVNIFTNSGIQLVGAQAAQLSFDAVGTITPASQWSADPTLRGVGTITLIPPSGTPIDLIAGPRNSFRNDRGLPADARSGSRPGAKSARCACRGDGVRTVRQDDRGNRGCSVAAKWIRRRYWRPVSRQYDHRQLHRHRDEYAAHHHAGAGRRSVGFAARQHGDSHTQTTRYSASISPAAWVRSLRRSMRHSPAPE